MYKDKFTHTLQTDLGKKSNLMTNKEQANNLEGANIECMGKDISNSINAALKASSKLIPLSAPKKATLPKEVTDINLELREKELKKSKILKNLTGKGPFSTETMDAVKILENDILNLQCKITCFLNTKIRENNLWVRKILKSKGTNNSTFWNIAKDVEIQNLISVKKKNGNKLPAKRKPWKELQNILGSLTKRRKNKHQNWTQS